MCVFPVRDYIIYIGVYPRAPGASEGDVVPGARCPNGSIASGRASGRASERTSERASEQADERASERTSERAGGRASERSSE